jgi:hypothetical protein
MDRVSTIGRFRAPLGGQDIELQQVDLEAGGMSLLRIRIREGRRFTVIDIDPGTAGDWAEAMRRWAGEQGKAPP